MLKTLLAMTIPFAFFFAVSCKQENQALKELQAFEFHHVHTNCKAWIRTEDKKKHSLFIREIKRRGWDPTIMKKDERLFEGELYFFLDQIKDGRLFKSCYVDLTLKKASGTKIQPGDRVLYRGSSTRHAPKVTFSGGERCLRALKDAFLHIPFCLTPAQAEKLNSKLISR